MKLSEALLRLNESANIDPKKTFKGQPGTVLAVWKTKGWNFYEEDEKERKRIDALGPEKIVHLFRRDTKKVECDLYKQVVLVIDNPKFQKIKFPFKQVNKDPYPDSPEMVKECIDIIYKEVNKNPNLYADKPKNDYIDDSLLGVKEYKPNEITSFYKELVFRWFDKDKGFNELKMLIRRRGEDWGYSNGVGNPGPRLVALVIDMKYVVFHHWDKDHVYRTRGMSNPMEKPAIDYYGLKWDKKTLDYYNWLTENLEKGKKWRDMVSRFSELKNFFKTSKTDKNVLDPDFSWDVLSGKIVLKTKDGHFDFLRATFIPTNLKLPMAYRHIRDYDLQKRGISFLGGANNGDSLSGSEGKAIGNFLEYYTRFYPQNPNSRIHIDTRREGT